MTSMASGWMVGRPDVVVMAKMIFVTSGLVQSQSLMTLILIPVTLQVILLLQSLYWVAVLLEALLMTELSMGRQ